MLDTTGAATYVYLSAGVTVDVLPSLMTVTLTIPEPAGAVAVIEVPLTTVT